MHVFYGGERWPTLIDLAVSPADLEIHGANGKQPGNTGDTLAYSGAGFDVGPERERSAKNRYNSRVSSSRPIR